jgi:hypothetical protein
MESTILQEKLFMAYRSGEPMATSPFKFTEEVSGANEQTIGYWSDGGCWHIDNICEAIELGFSTTPSFTLVLIN